MKDKLKQIFNIANKTVLITGATGFLGRYISRAFLEVGAKVILLGRSDKLSDQIRQYGREFHEDMVCGFCVDFYEREELEDTLREIVRNSDVDALINNAYDMSEKTGFNNPLGSLENSTYNQWKSAFDCGVFGAVLTTQIIGAQFRKARKGSIINISSMYGIVAPNPRLYEGTSFLNPATYGVNKAGIIALTRYTASFWGRYGIRCNVVLPGPFPNIESNSDNAVEPNAPLLDRLKKNTVLNRIGHPNELIGILIYLASDASSFTTGQTIVVDGGWTIT